MLLGELLKIDEDIIRSHHDVLGNNKQRFRPDVHRPPESGKYASMFPLTKDTILICLFKDPYSGIGTCYVSCGEPLLRKYPKRILGDSFISIGRECTVSVVGRVTNINRLAMDVRLAYLYLNILYLSPTNIRSYMGKHAGSLASVADIPNIGYWGDMKVKELVQAAGVETHVMLEWQTFFRSSMLASGAFKMGGRVSSLFRPCLGDILEELFSHERVEPPRGATSRFPFIPTHIPPPPHAENIDEEVVSSAEDSMEKVAEAPTTADSNTEAPTIVENTDAAPPILQTYAEVRSTIEDQIRSGYGTIEDLPSQDRDEAEREVVEIRPAATERMRSATELSQALPNIEDLPSPRYEPEAGDWSAQDWSDDEDE